MLTSSSQYCCNNNNIQQWAFSVVHSQLFKLSWLCIQTWQYTTCRWSVQCILCQGTLYWQFISFKPRTEFLIQEETNTQWTNIQSTCRMCLTMARYVAVCKNVYKYEIL